MRDYQQYSVGAADCYDRNPRWFRLIVCIVSDLLEGKFKGSYQRFLNLEIFLGEHSLRRKLNKLRYMGLLDEDHHS